MSEQINTAIRWATERCRRCSDSARVDAELLLAHCLEKPRSYLYSWPEKVLDEPCWQRFQKLVEKRLEPTPVAYLLGTREFYSMDYATTTAALVPRPETELLVDLALQQIPSDQAMWVCDLGTGTGIIAITLKKQRPLAKVSATDIDSACLALARANAQRHQVDIEFFESDWYQGIPTGARFDLIVSNPPYVAAGHPFLAEGDLPAEPKLALTPGVTGLEALQQIVSQAPEYLQPGGMLILEHGYDQQAAVANLLQTHGFAEIRCESDHNELPRTSIARLSDAVR